MKYKDFLESLSGCPFCEGSKNNRVILETDKVFLTYAIAPYYTDHLLVIPKRHIEHLLEISEEELRQIENIERKGFELLNKLGHKNISLLVREGNGSGKSVAHLHYHLIPDIALGNVDYSGAERKILSEEEITSFLKKIQPYL